MKTVIAVVVALVVIGGGWYWYTNYYTPTAPTTNTATTDNTTGANTTPEGTSGATGAGVGVDVNAGVNTAPTSATITLTSSGFSPKSVTIKKGGTITWVNEGTGAMWVASAQHPTHTAYDGTTREEHCAAPTATTFDECKTGNSFSFTFSKEGSWNYHNHSNSTQFGTVVVVE